MLEVLIGYLLSSFCFFAAADLTVAAETAVVVAAETATTAAAADVTATTIVVVAAADVTATTAADAAKICYPSLKGDTDFSVPFNLLLY